MYYICKNIKDMKFEEMINSIKVLKVVESLTGDGSQKAKQALIKESINPQMEYILDTCFNPFVTTKLHKVNFPAQSKDHNPNLWEEFNQLVEDLKKAPAANDSLRFRAETLLESRLSEVESEDEELRKTLMKILTKRMNIGIGAKLINKAVSRELIPDPSLMLATDNHSTIDKWDKIYCEEKYDGVRVIAIYKNGEITYFTRAFNELDPTCLSKITFSLKTAMINSGQGILGDWFFDGELTDLNRKSVSGKVTQILRGTAPKNIDNDMLFNVFDFDEVSTLNHGSGVLDYLTRRSTLEKVTSFLPDNSQVVLAKMWELDNPSDITGIYKQIVSDGGEGVICKNNHIYECSRSKSWVKFKEVNECDLEIVGWYPGEGKREGFIGGFIMTDASKTLNVKVGSGFTDLDLQSLSKDPDSHIGKIAAVLYNVTITDKHENRSLFLPRFVDIRHDKDSADDLSSKF
jgi:DNA ligase-1